MDDDATDSSAPEAGEPVGSAPVKGPSVGTVAGESDAPRFEVRGPRWGPVPASMFTDPDLEQSDKVVLGYLCTFMNREREAWPSLFTIAKAVGDSERTARRAVFRLRVGGWLKVSKQGFPATSVYEIAIEKGLFASEAVRPRKAGLDAQSGHEESPVRPRGARADRPRSVAVIDQQTSNSTQGTEGTAPAAPPPEPAKLSADYLWEQVKDYLHGSRPTGISYPAVLKRFRACVAAGDSTEKLNRAVDLWIVARPRNVTTGSFLAELDTLRARADGAAPAGPRKVGGLAGTEDRNRPDDFWGGAGS